MSESVITVRELRRCFGKVPALQGVNLDVTRGSIFGLLGTNGSGKTTLIRLLMGHLYPDSGSIQVFNSNPMQHSAATLRKVAYVSDQMKLPGRMPLQDVLRLNSQFFPDWNQDLAESLTKQLDVNLKAKFSQLSLGQKRRAVILQAVCQGADLLIMDEPLAGLDAIVRRQCLDMLLTAASEYGQTILISSHLLHDVERIVDTVAMLSNGKVVTSGNLEELKSKLRRIRFEGDLLDEDRERALKGFRVIRRRFENNLTDLVVEQRDDESDQTLSTILGPDVRIERLNLEEMFIELNDQSSMEHQEA